MTKEWAAILVLPFLLLGCVYQPMVSLQPMPGDDPRWDAECRQWAMSVTPPVTMGGDVATGAIGGAAVGAAGGAIGGAIAGDVGTGAGIGAGIGAGLGIIGGLMRESAKEQRAQAYINQAYANCMNAKRAASRVAPPPPPPPSGQYAPPPASAPPAAFAPSPPGPQYSPPAGQAPCRPSGKFVRTPQGGFVEICE